MAIDRNGGYSAVELLTDNSSAWRHKSFNKRLCRLFLRHHYIGIGNKQANPAERWIQTQSQLARKYKNFQYLGFASHFKNPEMRSNPDPFEKEQLPTVSEARVQIVQFNEAWNASCPTAKRHPRSTKPTEQDLRYAFGKHSEVSLSNCRVVLKVQRQLQWYYFDVPNWSETLDWANRVCTDRHLKIRVSWDDTRADLYAPDGSYYQSCAPVQKSSCYAEQTEATKTVLKLQRAKKKQFASDTEQQIEEMMARHMLVPQEDYHILAKEGKVKPATPPDLATDIDIQKLARSQY